MADVPAHSLVRDAPRRTEWHAADRRAVHSPVHVPAPRSLEDTDDELHTGAMRTALSSWPSGASVRANHADFIEILSDRMNVARKVARARTDCQHWHRCCQSEIS